MWDWRSAQVSQPQSSRLATPDWKMMYFDFRSTYGLFQKCLSAPMDLLACVMRWAISWSSVRSKEM